MEPRTITLRKGKGCWYATYDDMGGLRTYPTLYGPVYKATYVAERVSVQHPGYLVLIGSPVGGAK